MSTTEAPAKQRCEATKANGDQCGAWAVREHNQCAGHLGLGVSSDPVTYQALAAANRRAAGEEKREARKRTAKDWISHELQERGREIVAAAADAAVDGDWRAGAWLFDREYGKPAERIEHTGGVDMALLSRSERDDLVRKGLADEDLVELLPEHYRVRLAELEPGAGGI